ncbi:hypothetical protein BOX15_Mlig028476g1 [Macrostomum lignano]|uniref:Zinc transporter foi n=1 Tax=Macrostomum lignano TaxID=282301 RepID=A0A267DUH7_9PLAT|nr:hypothetical protein BOX15_Mlig028476g1 [Macrostomum lignano]
MQSRQLRRCAAVLILSAAFCLLPATTASGDHEDPEDVLTVSSNHTADESQSKTVSAKVWLISCVSILVISLVGLAGVAVVPLVQSEYYNHFIQYLVALAVGSLTGDAMLHLLPHAIVKSAMEDTHAEKYHKEVQTVYKGLVALGGVYFFFMAEKLVALVTEYRTERQALLEEERKEQEEGHPNRMSTLERQKRRASRLYGDKSCEDIITTGLSSKAMRSIDNFRSYLEYSDSEDGGGPPSDQQGGASPEATPVKQRYRPYRRKSHEPPPIRFNNAAEPEVNADSHLKPPDGGGNGGGGGGGGGGEICLVVPGQTARQAGQDEAKEPAGHSEAAAASGHGHSHGGEIPRSLASVAWMVILGDGLHNFTDGLAIGAAFAQSITGGISTSIAVFCHELPHELGDFAVLLKTGMAVKQALFYNIVSSVLAAVGMAIGVNIGTVTSASYWIFAITGGIFIYISLVDMLPELNLVNVRPGESRIAHFILQNAGILTGVVVMFLIAIYEHDIKTMLGEKEH